jgi:hypothetical protein
VIALNATPEDHDDNASKGPKPQPVTIKVNNQSVTMPNKHATGLGIKEAAIAAGVEMQLEWVLSDEKERIITDDKEVTLKDGDDFWAVPGDDNS